MSPHRQTVRRRVAVAMGLVLLAATAALTAGISRAHVRSPSLARAPRAGVNCSDFANQAAAQKFFDQHGGSLTNDVEGLDADHDGVACEALPCPCAGALSGGGSPPPNPQSGLGRSTTLHRVRKHAGCRLRGPLPDSGCTPGAYYAKATKSRVCRPGYAGQVRNVSPATKNGVYAAYGLRTHFNGQNGEVDHLISLELGGSNAQSNLFPEAAKPVPGSHQKDRLENRLHAEVCSGQVTLRTAQREIAGDWVSVYHQAFGG